MKAESPDATDERLCGLTYGQQNSSVRVENEKIRSKSISIGTACRSKDPVWTSGCYRLKQNFSG